MMRKRAITGEFRHPGDDASSSSISSWVSVSNHSSLTDLSPSQGEEKNGCCLSFVPNKKRVQRSSTGTGSSITDGEKLLANEMQSLSLEERETVYHDLHGVADIPQEDPAFVARSIQDLQEECQRLRGAQAYEKAKFLCPKYVSNPSFLLMFLRADSFDAKMAAKRIKQHFERKSRYFSLDVLGRDVLWSDLSPEEQGCYKRGATQCFTRFYKDSTGRGIHFENYKEMDFSIKIENQVRAVWYTFMEGARDEETQRKGIVFVLYCVGVSASHFYHAALRQTQNMIIDGLPVRPVSNHFCFDDVQLRSLFSMVLGAAPKLARLRLRLHGGSNLEVQYSLASYGIVPKHLPVDSEGKVKWAQFKQCMDSYLALEQERLTAQCQDMKQRGTIDCPTSNDVLIGRGTLFQYHPGNQQFTNLVSALKPRYDILEGDRTARNALSVEVLQRITSSGGRFLKRAADGQAWEQVPTKTAREKVSMAFRNLNRKDR